jgi:hypothetical protein
MKMADAKRFSEGLIDVAERFADVVDATEGRGARKTGFGARWWILPAAGAGAYALATSSSGLARQARKLMRGAKDRVTGMPDADLLGRVEELTGQPEQSSSDSSGRARQARRRPTRRSARSTQPRRNTASTR